MAQNGHSYNSTDEMTDRAMDTANRAMDVAQNLGGKAKRGVDRAASKATRGLRNRVRKLGKKAGKAATKAIKKAAVAIGKLLAKAFVALLPYILIIGIIVLIIILLTAFIYDSEYESKAVHDNYQTEEATEDNPLRKDQETGEYKAVGLSNGNKLFKMFYGYVAQRGYWKVVVDKNGNPQTDLLRGDSHQAQQIVDRYNREKYFTMSSDLLYLLDTEMNATPTNMFYFPEQFIQPVYHDEDFNLKMLTDDDHNLVVESTKFENGKATDEKVKGVWDYGFGSILQYQKFKEYREKRGSLTKTYEWDFDKHELVTIEYEIGESDDKIVENVPGYPQTTYLIRKVTTPIGTIERPIKHEWVQTNEKWTKTVKTEIPAEKKEIIYEPVHQENEDGEKLYWKYDPVLVWQNNEKITKKTEWPVIKYVKKEIWVPTTMEVEKVYTGYVWEKTPVYDGEVDTSGIVGDRYFLDYLSNYTTYVPDVVMEDFNIKERTGRDIEGLEEVFQEQQRVEEASSVFDYELDLFNRSGELKPSENVKVEKQKFENALKYLPLFEKYGRRYGVDPYLMVAMAAVESSGNHEASKKSYGGYGLMQIENPGVSGEGITSAKAFNFETGQMEIMLIPNKAAVDDIEDNIRAGAMLLQGRLHAFKYNIPAAIQAYNFGPGMTRIAMRLYAESVGKTLDEVMSNPQDTGWMEFREEIHLNPRKYYSDWKGERYGDPKYVEKILAYYAGPEGAPYAIDRDGNKITMSGDITHGYAIIGNGTNRNTGWLSSILAVLKDKWNELFENSPVDALQNKEDYTFTEYTNKMHEEEVQTFIRRLWSFSKDVYLSEVKYDITLDDWKQYYSILFENPNPVNYIDPETSAALERLNNLFPDGYRLPVDKLDKVSKEYDGVSIEFAVPMNSHVKAVADGEVVDVDKLNGVIEIKHTGGVITRYSNLKDIKVDKGDKVKMGDTIATVRKHLGFSIIDPDGSSVDPNLMLIAIGDGKQGYDYQTVLRAIESVKGYPYNKVGDANDPKSGYFDCSGLMQWAFKQVGINLPRTAKEQYDFVMKIDKSQARPGDLVFFQGTYGGPNHISHVGLYIGGGKMWNASTSKGVSIANINSSYWQSKNPQFGRIPASAISGK